MIDKTSTRKQSENLFQIKMRSTTIPAATTIDDTSGPARCPVSPISCENDKPCNYIRSRPRICPLSSAGSTDKEAIF